jgi:hypothetical protein
VAALVFALLANAAAAQSVNQPPTRDALWNGTLIGLGAGIGSAAALDAAFCDNGFGGCDFPWAAYLTLGGVGAGAGAGIDFLVGRSSPEQHTMIRFAPIVSPARKGVVASLVLPRAASLPTLAAAQQRASVERRDSVWDGALIGAGVGAAGGAIWGRQQCGATDTECFAIAGPVGILGGAAIGAAIGAVADALHH